MLSLTRKTDYALVALSYLTGRHAESAEPASAKQIAQTFGLPLPLLMNILKELVRAKVLASTRGSQGGYELAAEPGRISLLEVVTAMEGPVRLSQCADGLPIVGQGCNLSDDCPIQGPIRSLHKRINRFLEEVTLKDLWEDRIENNETRVYKTDHNDSCACSSTHPTAELTELTGVTIHQGA